MVAAADSYFPLPEASSDALPLAELWQELDAVIRCPESLALASLFRVMAQAIDPLPLSDQLAIAGLVFDQLAGVVSQRASLLMESWESWHRPTDPILNFSRDPDLFVQSQRLELSDLIDTTPVPVFYPLERQSDTTADAAFEAAGDGLSPGLGSDARLKGTAAFDGCGDSERDDWLPSCGLAPDSDVMPLTETELLTAINARSYGENIPLWSRQVAEAMRSLVCVEHVSLTRQQRHVTSMPFTALQKSLHIPLVEVWLALLLGDSGYALQQGEASSRSATDSTADEATLFYSGESLQVVRLTYSSGQ